MVFELQNKLDNMEIYYEILHDFIVAKVYTINDAIDWFMQKSNNSAMEQELLKIDQDKIDKKIKD